MSLFDRARLLSFHRQLMADFGPESVEALAWNDRESQEIRFQQFLALGDFSRASVLDVGCGRGDLKAFLEARFSEVDYTGIDLVPEFLASAQQRFGHQGQWLLGDVATGDISKVDYVLVSGTLNYRFDEPEQIFQSIERLWQLSAKGIGFNLLKKVEQRSAILQGYTPEIIVRFCESLSAKVTLMEGYLENDFTLLLKK